MQPNEPQLTFLGKALVSLFIIGCAWVAFAMLKKSGDPAAKDPTDTGIRATSEVSPSPASGGKSVTVGIAYGTEKKRWLTWAREEFAKTPEGKRIEIDLIPMGSLEGARAVVGGDERIHVWSPASSAYKDVFLTEWDLKYGNQRPIAREEQLALSPMVFVFWKERYDAFLGRYEEVNFTTIGEALALPDGWAGIANKPEWGFFKFGHTNPNESNSGLLTLTLMAHHFHKKLQPLQMADIMNPEFQKWHAAVESAVSGLSNSTGNMMKEMVLKGPSSFDGIIVYENVAIDYLKNAEGRWGTLQVAYPERNMWNDNPYYILDAEWSGSAERKAAGEFLDYLMSPAVQRQSLVHGFRPGDPAISIKEADGPFVQYEKYGLKIALDSVCEPPTAQAINELLTGWQRIRGGR